MAIFYGFNTTNLQNSGIPNNNYVDANQSSIKQSVRRPNKFRLTDEYLVIQDLINALSIKVGDKVGQPEYGTTLWEYIFDPNTSDVVSSIENEIRRVINNEPRIALNELNIYTYENGLLVEIQATVHNIDNYLNFGLLIDKTTGTVQYMAA